MATPPRIGTEELAATMRLIVKRRVKVDDPHAEQLPDPDQADPRDLLEYLHRYPAPRDAKWVREADIADALTLHVWLWWEDQRRLLRTLRAGRHAGLFLTQMGAPLGIRTRAGTRDLIDRLEALLAYDRPDEKIGREARRADRNRDARSAFVRANRDELHTLTADLMAAADRFGVDDRDWLDELKADADADQFSPASLAVLNLAAAEVRTSPGVLELDSTHNVHRVLRRADDLRRRFATSVRERSRDERAD